MRSDRSRLALALGALAVSPAATLVGSDATVNVLLPLAAAGPVLAGVGAAVVDRSRGLCDDRSDRAGFLALVAGAGALWGFAVAGAHLVLVESTGLPALAVLLLLFGSLAGAASFCWIAAVAGPFYAATLLALPPGERRGEADSR
ncbi:hypothetical protein [Halomicrobium urmianum]|uniref:hypothetical protein n=1 Tax=Halomicrobium urmianum TaxID=1586233 RepID=UPI001CD9508C|nr:hypothetical protein [Halomicrobium urmianum]